VTDGLTTMVDFGVVLDVIGDQVTIIDQFGNIVWVNRRATELLHRSGFDVIGRNVLDYVHPEDAATAIGALADARRHTGPRVTTELRIDDGQGGWTPLEFISSTMTSATTGETLVVVSSRSLRWRWAARDAAALIGRGGTFGEVVEQLARVAREMLEVPYAEIEWGTTVERFGTRRSDTALYERALFDTPGVAALRVEFEQPERPWVSDERAFREIGRMATVLRQRERDLARLRYQASHDDLTGFDNRRATNERLSAAVATGPAAVLFVDLDNFKLVNDSLGYDVGDDVLQAAAARLLTAVSGRGAVGRYGGDEFVVTVAGPPAVARSCAQDIVVAFREPLQTEGRALTLSVSIGVAHVAESSSKNSVVEALVRDAGTALHQAKVEGRDRWTLFHDGLRQTVVERLEVSQAVRQAFELDTIELHYQPQIELATGNIVGYEALLRWRGPDRLPGSAAQFLEVAADIGILSQLSRHTLIGGCRQLARWRIEHEAAANWFIGVNLAAQEIDSPMIVDLVEEALELTGLRPADLQLEIVEHAFAAGGTAMRNLTTLSELGVGLAIDDFGVGESSLARLRDLPIDTLKIDRSLITGVLDDRTSHAIASSIATLGHRLGVTVVAEGIETEADREGAHSIGCHRAQGYLIGRPMSAGLLFSGDSVR
jgi:diguanylate cyclase (GGDEF)-like protein/PAS domain S-box-containing protein